MTQLNSTGLTVDQVQEMVRRELSAPSRICYLLLFMMAFTAAGLIDTLWLTEPMPLPLRTHISFGLLVAVNLAWSGLSAWVLSRRKVLYALDHVIAGWMAVTFCGVFLLAGLGIAIVRMNITASVSFGLLGMIQLVVAIAILTRARHRREHLLARRQELTDALARRLGQ